MMRDGRHPWMQTLNIAAICPKCNEPELRRSHARSLFERMIKDHTLKRPFRCHACGWRGWCDETALTFPITPEKLQASRPISADDSIPDFTLDVAHDPHLPSAGGRPVQMQEGLEFMQTERLETEGHLAVQRVGEHFHDDEHHRSVTCPRCATFSLYRSHARDLGERMRKFVTLRRPYRCHACGWRGWVDQD